MTKHKTLTVYLLAVLFLPGTIIHEISHFLMAKLLFVHTGKIKLSPEMIGSDIIMGTLQIGKTDFFRRFLIGLAPFLFGNIFLFSIILVSKDYFLTENKIYLLFFGYMIFQIGNTMFSSKKDMEGAFKLILVVGVVLLSAYILGVRINPQDFFILSELLIIIKKACIYLFIPLIIDLSLLVFLKAFNR